MPQTTRPGPRIRSPSEHQYEWDLHPCGLGELGASIPPDRAATAGTWLYLRPVSASPSADTCDQGFTPDACSARFYWQ